MHFQNICDNSIKFVIYMKTKCIFIVSDIYQEKSNHWRMLRFNKFMKINDSMTAEIQMLIISWLGAHLLDCGDD